MFVGPSGCGKTTLLRLIAGLEEVSSGRIYLDQKELTWIEPKNRGVAMVFQNYALYPHLTVEKNLLYPLSILKLPKEEKQARVKQVSEMLEISSLLARKPAELSGGQRQRVAIGRALVRQPDIFLFDEPLSNLDARLREQMRLEILNLHSKLKRTTIYVTHDQYEAMTLSETLVVMNQGRIIQKGNPLELYKNPNCLFVAQFLGSPPINIIKGQVTKEGNFESPVGNIALKPNHSFSGEALLGIRPENFMIEADDNPGYFKGKVLFMEHLGREIHLRVESEGFYLWIISKDKIFVPGENIRFSVLPENRLWFSPSSQNRILDLN